MKKKALLAVLLVMTLMLSSCALIVKDAEVDGKTEILRLGDKVVTKAEVKDQIDYQLSYNAYYYSLFGSSYDTTDATNIANVQDQVITALKKDLVIRQKAKDLGLDLLTEEELEHVKEHAQEDYNESLDYIKTSTLADSGLEGDELTKAAEEELTKRGITVDTYITEETDTQVDEKVRDYIIKDVAVTDEEIQADYDSKVAADKEKYAESAGTWASAANNGTTLYYTPAGVRRVKQILTKFRDEDQTAITDANTKVTEATSKVTAAQQILDDENATEEEKTQATADKAAAEAELAEANTAVEEAKKAAYANIDADVDAILAELEGGADWDTLMAEKTQDPGMQSGTTAEKGYAVSADMTSFDSAFVEAAMALAAKGDVSGKVASDLYGYYIIKYVDDEAEGDIGLDAVKESISSSLLTTKQNETYNTTIDEWVQAAGIKEDLNALKD